MSYILAKYNKYEITYNLRKGIVHIHKQIPVKEYVRLKKDIKKKGYYVVDIIVGK